MKDFDLSMNPVEAYQAPEIPKLGENNPDLLKKLPSRWQKNAKIIAGLGLAGVFAFSGCGNVTREIRPSNVENTQGGYNIGTAKEIPPYGIEYNPEYVKGYYNGYSDDDLLVRLHSGGSGISFYMVYLTEQEALGIIRARLEASGLNFDATPPPGIVLGEVPRGDSWMGDIDWHISRNFDYIEIELFDEQKGVGVAHVGWLGTGGRGFGGPIESQMAERIDELFTERLSDIVVGTFYNPGARAGDTGSWTSTLRHPTNAEVAERRPALERNLITQAEKFIARLQLEGILERFPDIDVYINGAPFNTDEHPIIINNQKMVPAIELFWALGMFVAVDNFEGGHAITALQHGVRIHVSSFGRNEIDNGQRRGMPVFIRDGIILVPLQIVAEAAGATVDWNDAMRIINISIEN